MKRFLTLLQHAFYNRSRIVFLTVSDGIKEGDVIFGTGENIRLASLDAIKRLHDAKTERRYRFVKMDIVTLVRGFEDPPMTGRLSQERSLIGLALDVDLQAAFVPEESYAYTLISNKQILQPGNIAEAHNARSIKAGKLSKAQVMRTPFLYVYHTDAWFYDGHRTMELYRGHRMFDPQDLSNELLLQSVRAAGDYLRRAVKEDGSFEYRYLPKQDETVPDEYNTLRHCGTVYSMLDLYGTTKDDRLLEASTSAIRWMIKHIKPWDRTKDQWVLVDEDGDVKLGGNAWALPPLCGPLRAAQDQLQVA